MSHKTVGHAGRFRWYYWVIPVLLIPVLAFGGLLVFLTVFEYRPEPVEPAEAGTFQSTELYQNGPLRILTFNTGYCGLGKDEDFLMDGGSGTGADDPESVLNNLEGIKEILRRADADIYLLQETDMDSDRTFHVRQVEEYDRQLAGYERYFAPNYRCRFVPYPLQRPIGDIDSGLATFSRYHLEDVKRHSLPLSFKWPVRMANLKRCLLVSRLPVEGSDQEIVIINLHLEAYDDGAGKVAQTKQLLSLLEEEYQKGNYVIAGGDFNQIFPEVETVVKDSSAWIPGKLTELPEEWRYIYDENKPTCRLLNRPYNPEDETTQHYLIDGFIVSPNVEVSKVQTMEERFVFSDHNPVIMEISLK